jgi:hypothetical protein
MRGDLNISKFFIFLSLLCSVGFGAKRFPVSTPLHSTPLHSQVMSKYTKGGQKYFKEAIIKIKIILII